MAQKKSQADNQDSGIKKPESRKEKIQEVMPMSKRRALVVGINDYQGTWNDLPSSVKDAESFKDFLNHNLGFTEIKVLTDRQATLTNVVSGLDWLLEDANPQDRLVFYYSGHGTTRPNSNIMQEYLNLYDDLLEDEEIIRRTRDLPQGVFTAIIDCCFSGGIEKRRYEAVARGFSETPSSTMTLERAKVKTYVSDPQQLLALEDAEKKATFYKPFGQAARLTPSGYSKSAANPNREQINQTLLNGTLIASCIHDETAVADTSQTNGLSAFTFALLKVCEQRGLSMNLGELLSLITMELRMLGLRQTPRVKVSAEALISRSLMNLDHAFFNQQYSSERINEQGFVSAIVNEVLSNLQIDPQGMFSTNTPNSLNQWRETMYTQFETPLYNNMIPNQLEANREFIRRNYMQPSYGTMPGAYFPFPQHQMHFGHQFPMPQPPVFGQHFPQWREQYGQLPQWREQYGQFPHMMHQPPSYCVQSCERIAQFVTMSLPLEYRQQFAPIIWNVLPLISERISSLFLRSQQFGVLPVERHQIELIIANTLTSVFQVIIREEQRRFTMGHYGQVGNEMPILNIISTVVPVIVETIEREKVRLAQQGLTFTPEIVTTISQHVILQLQNLLPLNILQTIVPQLVEAIVRQNWAPVAHTNQVPTSQTTPLRSPTPALV